MFGKENLTRNLNPNIGKVELFLYKRRDFCKEKNSDPSL